MPKKILSMYLSMPRRFFKVKSGGEEDLLHFQVGCRRDWVEGRIGGASPHSSWKKDAKLSKRQS